MDLALATGDYEVFDLLTPLPNTPEDMGIQRKPQRSLQELLESQPGGGRLEGLPNPSFLPLLPNPLLVPLGQLLHLGLNNLIQRGEGSPRVRR